MATALDQQVSVVVRGGAAGLRHDIEVGSHRLIADEGVDVGGSGQGPSPYELLLSALGACTAMTLRVYANLKKLPLTGVRVELTHRKVEQSECPDCHTETGKVDKIERRITLEGALSDDQRKRLLEIANKCPVHRTLKSDMVIVSTLG